MHARLMAAMVLGTVLFAACAADSPLGGARASTVTMRFLTPATVKSLIVEVTGPGIDPAVVLNIAVGADTVATGSLTLPSGSARRFVVTAVDTAGVQTHRADTTITLQPGANPSLAMRLEPLPSTLGITVTFGGVRLVVPDTSTRVLDVGDTTVIAAYAIRANGDTVPPDSLAWGTSNPALVTVTNGRVRRIHSGDARVTMSIQGVAASVLISAAGSDTVSFLIVADNDFAVFAGTEAGISRALYQNNEDHWEQARKLATIRAGLLATESYLYIVAFGAGGPEDIGGNVNGVDITSYAGAQRVIGRVDTETIVNGYLLINSFLEPVENERVRTGTFEVSDSHLAQALTGAVWGAAESNGDAGDGFPPRHKTSGEGALVNGRAWAYPEGAAVVFRFPLQR